MALVKIDDTVRKSTWSKRDERAPRHKIGHGSVSGSINYNNLQQLCSIDGLGDAEDEILSKEAHDVFMKNYRSIFQMKETSRKSSSEIDLRLHKGLPSYSAKELPHGPTLSICKYYSVFTFYWLFLFLGSRGCADDANVHESHNIHDHLSDLHRQRVKVDPNVVKEDSLASLRRLLRKLPFERTRGENESIYHLVKMFDTLTAQVEPHILRELCSVAILDIWDEEGITVYGNRGFYVILVGQVQASVPYLKLVKTEVQVRCPTPELDDTSPILKVGDCFGTFEPIDGKAENSRVLSVSTSESRCEFLLITASDYARITQGIRSREENRRINLLQSCKNYTLWSRQSLLVIASLIKWVKYIPNTVVVVEGSKAPFMAIVKSGECKVTRRVNTLATLSNLKQVKRTTEVFIGKLVPFESFGETNVLSDVPMSCTITTQTPVELAVVYPQDVRGIDSVTRQLIRQSCGKVFGEVSEDEVHDQYMKRELDRQWTSFKKGILNEAIDASGIHPGHGKWTK